MQFQELVHAAVEVEAMTYSMCCQRPSKSDPFPTLVSRDRADARVEHGSPSSAERLRLEERVRVDRDDDLVVASASGVEGAALPEFAA